MPSSVIILAAGNGQRFQSAAGQGADKLMAPCRGLDSVIRPVLEQTLRNLDSQVVRRILVTRSGKQGIIDLATAYGCEIVLLDSAGMGDSLAAGVAASVDASGWLICLGDMPFIQAATYGAMLGAMDEQRICVPAGPDGYGHPVAFGRRFAKQLLALQGDQGARRLFEPGSLMEIPTDDPGIYRDVDLPDDLP